jgi:hypothetical protein
MTLRLTGALALYTGMIAGLLAPVAAYFG